MIDGNGGSDHPPRPLSLRRWPVDASPVVSVVVAAYNQERFIAQCLESVLAQVTDFPVEIIAHDDASTDRTAQVIAAYAQKYPSMVKPVLQTQNLYVQHRKATRSGCENSSIGAAETISRETCVF